MKRSWVLGLSPNDERDPQNEQKQQPGHCCEPWVPSHQPAGPLGQYQAQDGQQESCKGQVGGEQMQLQKLNVSRPWLTSLPQTAHIKKSYYISKIPKAHPPNLTLSTSEHHERDSPLLTQQQGTSIDHLTRFPSGAGVHSDTQASESL